MWQYEGAELEIRQNQAVQKWVDRKLTLAHQFWWATIFQANFGFVETIKQTINKKMNLYIIMSFSP